MTYYLSQLDARLVQKRYTESKIFLYSWWPNTACAFNTGGASSNICQHCVANYRPITGVQLATDSSYIVRPGMNFGLGHHLQKSLNVLKTQGAQLAPIMHPFDPDSVHSWLISWSDKFKKCRTSTQTSSSKIQSILLVQRTTSDAFLLYLALI